MKNRSLFFLFAAFTALVLAGCSSGTGGETPVAGETPATEPAPGPTPTSFQPPSPDAEPTLTPTSVPLALTVNGVSITLDEFNLALQRFHLGIPDAPSEEAFARVLADYTDQILLEQAAYEAGFALSDEDWQARYASLIADAGGEEAFTAWLETNLYPRSIFEQDLRRSIAAAWMRDSIYAEVPTSAEQVRARHVRTMTRTEAENVLEQLNSGTSFDIMVLIYDPEGLGDLGWFPKGYLFQPAIEQAAFGLSVGDYSAVIETTVGFHIVQTTDYSADRPLDPDAYWTLQQAALDQWLAERQAQGAIDVFVP